MTALALAAAQTVPVRGDVAANIEEHHRLARAAAAEGARVLLFPELSLTGYELALADELAFSEHDERLSPLVAAATAHGMFLIVGAPVRVEGQLYIGAFILSPDGSIGVYTKPHLGAFRAVDAPDGVVPPAEDSVFRHGTLNPLLHVDGHALAMSICADSLHDSHAEQAAARGATTYLSSQFAIPAHLRLKLSMLKKHALRHEMTVVVANYGGPTGGLPAAGCSGIWSRSGERLVRLDERGAGVALAIEAPGGWRTRAIML